MTAAGEVIVSAAEADGGSRLDLVWGRGARGCPAPVDLLESTPS